VPGRAARLLQLLERLRTRRQPVAGTVLAGELSISLRTLYRDIATLREQGAQIEGDPGVGYVLRPGFTLPPLMFSADELEALVLGARWVAGHTADSELARAAQAAMQRVSAVLPTGLRLAIETNSLFVPAYGNPPPPAPWLPVLRRAIRDEHALQIDYRDESGAATQRRIWPFAMAFFDEAHVIAAWCELRQDFRHFRADRVLALADSGHRYPDRRHALMRRWRAQQGIDPAGPDC
jgi:predicted DNA-binding transcriptional regulator YafY